MEEDTYDYFTCKSDLLPTKVMGTGSPLGSLACSSILFLQFSASSKAASSLISMTTKTPTASLQKSLLIPPN